METKSKFGFGILIMFYLLLFCNLKYGHPNSDCEKKEGILPNAIFFDGNIYIYKKDYGGYRKGPKDFTYDKYCIEKDIDNDGDTETFFLLKMLNEDTGKSGIFLFILKDDNLLPPIYCHQFFRNIGPPIEFIDVNNDGTLEVAVHSVDGAFERHLQIFLLEDHQFIEVFDKGSTTLGCFMDKKMKPFKITVYKDRIEEVKIPPALEEKPRTHGHLYHKEIYIWEDDRFIRIHKSKS